MINIVLFEPEIPDNTANIIRTCFSFNINLHLIRPYGFILDYNKLKRGFTNHIDKNKIFEYNDWDDFLEKNEVNDNNIFLFTKLGQITPDKIEINNNLKIYLVFGRESSGISKYVLNLYNKNQWVRIPMLEGVISINLSNCVAIGSYEVLRKLKFKGLI